MSQIKALALLSGGLDSTLAIKLVQEQGLFVHALHFYTGFCITEQKRILGIKKEDGSQYINPALKSAAQLGVPIEVVDVSEEYVNTLLNPKYGYGKNINPCIDCRIMMLRKAKEIMDREGYHFRPLSAKLLPPTVPERMGLVDRERLLNISGRGRKVQISLAKRYGIDYEQPSGGRCYLTDPNYALKFKETLEREGSITREDLVLLSVGRHLRLPSGVKLVVARNEREVNFLSGFKNRYGYAQRKDQQGTLVIIKGVPKEEEYPLIAGVVCRYSKREPAEVIIKAKDDERFILGEPLDDEVLESFKILKGASYGVG
jgi:tRNA-specific 2-thiouridylase